VYSLKTHIVICASLFGAMIGIAMVGNILQAAEVFHDIGPFKTPMVILLFGLFIAAGFSAIPVMVMLVFGFQRKIGNADVPVVAAVLKTEKLVIYVLWALMAAGLIVAIPAAIHDGFFTPTG
jgi:hypothetical protein